jgi:hypothetical protein
MAQPKKTSRSSRGTGDRGRGRKTAAEAAAGPPATIQCWPTDPLGGMPVIQVPAPPLPGTPLATNIIEPNTAPPAAVHAKGTPEFRYWTAAEAMRRTAGFWTGREGLGTWNPDVGARLPVRLDDGVDLNAYYARNDYAPRDIKQGLSFFHDTVFDPATGRAVTVFSGESADVVAHELGHAVLDALKPALFNVSTTETAAFHESFGDMTAILAALQLPTVRQSILEETGGRLSRNSSISRLAEQLGWGIRQRRPDKVDRDSLRNASNSFIYTDPTRLAADGPASGLTRAPHNFSRVFTGAFLECLGGMVVTLSETPTVDHVEQASREMGDLLARAIKNAPVRTDFFRAVAEQLVLADATATGRRYAQVLTTTLVRRGLLPARTLATGPEPEGGRRAGRARGIADAASAAVRTMSINAGGVTDEGVAADPDAGGEQIAIEGTSVGLPFATLYVEAPAVDAHRVPGLGIAEGDGDRDRFTAVQAFVEQLVVRGRVDIDEELQPRATLASAVTGTRPTHRLVARDGGAELQRITFDCGCGASSCGC